MTSFIRLRKWDLCAQSHMGIKLLRFEHKSIISQLVLFSDYIVMFGVTESQRFGLCSTTDWFCT